MLYDFKIKTISRVVIILLLFIAIAYSLVNGQWAVAVLLAIPVIGLLWNLFYYIDQTNRDLAAFFKSVQYNDFTTTTSGGHKGKSFKALHDGINMINERFQEVRAEKEANHQFLQAIIEHIDIGLLGYKQSGEVTLMNKALQQILHRSYLIEVSTIQSVDEQLWQTVNTLQTGERALVKLSIDNKLQQIAIQSMEIKLMDELYFLLSFQNIQNELEQQELLAFQKLIRILTHEIMNSVAPISSLSSTLSDIIERDGAIDYQQLKQSLKVIKKRSDGLLDFTETYRTLTRIPPPHIQTVEGNRLLEELVPLFKIDLAQHNIALKLILPPHTIHFEADPILLEQVIINLIKNAADAVKECDNPSISLILKKSGGKTNIIVADNGTGISKETMEEIFVPFFTTKEHGSGIGLSLSRQIIRLHKGKLSIQSRLHEGTVATIEI